MVTNLFYNTLIWSIVDKFTPHHIAIANVLVNFRIFLFYYIFGKKDNEIDNKEIFSNLIGQIILIFNTWVHNEVIILNFWGLNEYTQANLWEKAKLDIFLMIHTKTDDSLYMETESEDGMEEGNYNYEGYEFKQITNSSKKDESKEFEDNNDNKENEINKDN